MRWVERVGSSYTGERAIDFTTYFADREVELSLSSQNKEQIIRLCNMGRKIEAIKLYRTLTSTGLKEAKAAVEALEKEGTPLATVSGERDELHRLVQMGKKIEAIKYYRQTTGVGLKEAKAVVENLVTDRNVVIATTPIASRLIDPDELRRLLQTGKKIEAIKYYRQTTGVGLKEAKESVEWVEAQMDQE
jgi:ribosomal protein L7/L12